MAKRKVQKKKESSKKLLKSTRGGKHLRIDKEWEHRTEIQKIQQKVQNKVNKIKRDHREDRSLIVAYQNGNEEAGRALLENYLDIISEVYRYPYHRPIQGRSAKGLGARKPDMNAYDKEDILQEILYAFFVLVEEYDEEKNFEGLIKGKLHHRFFNNFFDEYMEVDLKEEEFEDDFEGKYMNLSHKASIIIDSEETPEKLPSNYLELYQAFNQLSKKQREVLELSLIKGWNSSEIAEEIDSSAPAVRKLKERGLEKLKTIMGAD
jgi:RNA polymerase sigma factor (sigma-70 family)